VRRPHGESLCLNLRHTFSIAQTSMLPIAIVHVVDDEPQVCQALASLLGAAGLTVRSHTSAELFFQAFDPTVPGCIVVDVCMPGMSGLSLQERLANENVSTPIIILTGYADIPMAVEAMAKGARGFLQKPPRSHELLELVTSAVNWHAIYLNQSARSDIRDEVFKRLTEREHEVLRYVVDGKASKEIAQLLRISQRTVEQHRAHIMQKLEVDSLAELVRLCMEAGKSSPTTQIGRIEWRNK
jgi:two-component system, LuxR family, response regulator FixJ